MALEQASDGIQQPTIFTTSRFLTLPGEIRTMIYNEVFRDAELHITVPQRYYDDVFASHHVPDELLRESTGATLPGLLLVSKAVRCEALPVFSQSIVVVVLAHEIWADAFRKDHRLDQYIRDCRSVELRLAKPIWIDKALCPKLQRISVGGAVRVDSTFIDTIDELKHLVWLRTTLRTYERRARHVLQKIKECIGEELEYGTPATGEASYPLQILLDVEIVFRDEEEADDLDIVEGWSLDLNLGTVNIGTLPRWLVIREDGSLGILWPSWKYSREDQDGDGDQDEQDHGKEDGDEDGSDGDDGDNEDDSDEDADDDEQK